MKSFFTSFIFALLCLSSTLAFSVAPVSVVPSVSGASSSTALNVFGNKKAKSAAELEAESKYWQGEWVCKDCGYIYNRVRARNCNKLMLVKDALLANLICFFVLLSYHTG